MISFDKNRTKATTCTSFCHLSKIDIVLFSTKYIIDILNPLQNQSSSLKSGESKIANSPSPLHNGHLSCHSLPWVYSNSKWIVTLVGIAIMYTTLVGIAIMDIHNKKVELICCEIWISNYDIITVSECLLRNIRDTVEWPIKVNKHINCIVNCSYNRGQKCWENCWELNYFSQIGCSCKIPSPLLPHSMLNEMFHPGATLYGAGGVADGFDSLFTDI